MAELDDIIKAYDIRGTVPNQLNDSVAAALGVAIAKTMNADEIVVARDMRASGEGLAEAFMDAVQRHGVDVIEIGLASSDLLYFASGSLDRPGVIFTASHNPARYNGLKFCRAGARPVEDTSQIKAIAQAVLDGHEPAAAAAPGRRHRRNMLDAFVEHVLSFVDTASWQPMRVVADTANGMGGLVVPAVFERIDAVELEMMYAELDGTFPNHPADPLQPANQRDLRARVASGGFDAGLAFDGDADRVFVVDENARGLSGSTTTAMLAAALLRTNPGATILYNLICSRAVPEVIAEHGGTGIRTQVGHSFIKQRMAETGALFGGEHSAHYYFAGNFRADSGLVATVHVLDEMSRSGPLSEVRTSYERYAQSGEINTEVFDVAAVLANVRAEFAPCEIDELDGLSIDCGSYWFNLRPSNTEPLLRLNLEASTRDECDTRVAQLLSVITAV